MNIQMEEARQAQRTRRGLDYEERLALLHEKCDDAKWLRERSAGFLRGIAQTRASLGEGGLYQEPTLTNLSIAYKNDDFIGDRLMPIVSVDKDSGKYVRWDRRSALNAPDDNLGKRAKANEINRSYDYARYSLDDYGLAEFVDSEDLGQADAPFREALNNTDALNNSLALKRELRQAAILTNAASYGGNTLSLTGSEWNTTDGDPIGVIRAARAQLLAGNGPTRIVGFGSLDVINALLDNPKIVDRVKYTGGGIFPVQVLANYLGLDEILIGESVYDAANEGQASATITPIWGEVFGLVRVARTPSTKMAAFGMTPLLRSHPKTTSWFDPAVGVSGGFWNRVARSEDYVVMSPQSGFLFTNPLE